MKEIWKDIPGYEGYYQVSNFGRVKSLERKEVKNQYSAERILKPGRSSNGYLTVVLSLNKNKESKTIHTLVASAFLNHIPNGYKLVVNHKDFNRQNNNLNNIEIVTHRENTNHKHLKNSSKYTGVCWDKKYKKWKASIYVNGRLKHIGMFFDEIEASKAYQLELKKINNE